MRQETFYNYRNFRWFWFHVFALCALTGMYYLDEPIGGASGGTLLGYTYGILAALGIVVLTWLGVRRRSYKSRVSTVQGWLAVHIWLGVALLFVVPLHCAFSFGWNVHTLAYVFMCMVIFSGMWGALNYAVLSREIGSHRGEGKPREMLDQIESLGRELDAMPLKKSDEFVRMIEELNFRFTPGFWAAFGFGVPMFQKEEVAGFLSTLPDTEREAGMKALALVGKKREIARKLLNEARVKTLLKIWLYLHLPLTGALLVTLTIHIIAVLFFR